MKTYSTKMSDVSHAWHVLDATDQPLGRLASQAAALLRGKHKPIFQPNLPVGDFVVIVNAERVKVTGNKEEGKVYYRHSQYPGGLKVTKYRHQMEKFPARAVEKAVKGMLPHNSLGRKLFTRLKVYAGPEHPHGAQVAENALTVRQRRSAPQPSRAATAKEQVEAEVTEATEVETPVAEAETVSARAEAAPTAAEASPAEPMSRSTEPPSTESPSAETSSADTGSSSSIETTSTS
jgi:large subunit ribosomal protein L13